MLTLGTCSRCCRQCQLQARSALCSRAQSGDTMGHRLQNQTLTDRIAHAKRPGRLGPHGDERGAAATGALRHHTPQAVARFGGRCCGRFGENSRGAQCPRHGGGIGLRHAGWQRGHGDPGFPPNTLQQPVSAAQPRSQPQRGSGPTGRRSRLHRGCGRTVPGQALGKRQCFHARIMIQHCRELVGTEAIHVQEHWPSNRLGTHRVRASA